MSLVADEIINTKQHVRDLQPPVLLRIYYFDFITSLRLLAKWIEVGCIVSHFEQFAQNDTIQDFKPIIFKTFVSYHNALLAPESDYPTSSMFKWRGQHPGHDIV